MTTEPHADTVVMTKRLSATDPEPPIGSIVLDDIGQRWVRFDVDGRCWAQIEADGSPVDDDTESWIKVAGNYGPVLLIDGSITPENFGDRHVGETGGLSDGAK